MKTASQRPKAGIAARIAAAALVAALAMFGVLGVVGCSQPEEQQQPVVKDYVGHWTCTMVDAGNGQVVSVDELKRMEISGDDLMSLDLNEDHTAYMSSAEGDISQGVSLTWQETMMGIEIDTSNGESVELSFDNSTGFLSMEYQGQRIIFEKS